MTQLTSVPTTEKIIPIGKTLKMEERSFGAFHCNSGDLFYESTAPEFITSSWLNLDNNGC